MKLPVLIPKELNYLTIAADSEKLFEMLEREPLHLFAFLTYAGRDGSYVEEYQLLMRKLLHWVTEEFFDRKLAYELAEEFYKLVHENSRILTPLLPLDLTVTAEGEKSVVNSLMLAMSSPVLHELVYHECQERENKELALSHGSYDSLINAIEYVSSGAVENLWKKGQKELLVLIGDVSRWGIEGMVLFCVDVLRRYINKTNVVDFLLMAYRERWWSLRDACLLFLNDLSLGITFPLMPKDQLMMRFTAFTEEGLYLFDRIKKLVTHLAFTESLPKAEEFSSLVQHAPHLVSLELSQVAAFSDRFYDIPNNIEELNLSMCDWLGAEELQFFIKQCPNISALNLSSNGQLSYKAWSKLQQWKRLEKLELARCHQMSDEDLFIICTGAPHLRLLNLEEAFQLTDRGFEEIAKTERSLEILDLSRCKITDVGLISICYNCRKLRRLNLTRCSNISDHGIKEVALQESQLHTLNISQTAASKAAVNEIRRKNSMLELIIL